MSLAITLGYASLVLAALPFGMTLANLAVFRRPSPAPRDLSG